MKRYFLLAAFGLMAGVASLSAQAPFAGGMPGGAFTQFQMPVSKTPEEKTAEMTEKYNLTPEQQEAVLALNKHYDGKLEFRMEMNQEERPDFRRMTDDEREAYFNQMSNRMADMQERQQQIEKNQKEYEAALKAIFDKKQLKIYKKEKRQEEIESQRAMLRQQQNGFRGMPMGGPMGGGGFGGGFPGGGFGGGF